MVSFTLPAQKRVREQYAVKVSTGTAGKSVVCHQLQMFYCFTLSLIINH